jgi:hypothetical protein
MNFRLELARFTSFMCEAVTFHRRWWSHGARVLHGPLAGHETKHVVVQMLKLVGCDAHLSSCRCFARCGSQAPRDQVV